MSDVSFLNLTALAAGSLQADDVLPIVDVHDSTQSPGGSTKRILLSALYTNPTFAGLVTAASIVSDVFRAGVTAGVVDVRSAGSLRFWKSDNSASIDLAYSGGIVNVTAGVTLGGALTVTGSAATATIASTTADAYLGLTGANTAKNFRLGKSITVSNAFEIQASASNGGTDYATILTLQNTGAATLVDLTIAKNASSATLTLNPTAGGIGDASQIVLQRNGVSKWIIGNNVTSGSDTFSIAVNGVGSALDVNLSTRAVTIAAGLTVTGSTSLAALNLAGNIVAGGSVAVGGDITVNTPTQAQVNFFNTAYYIRTVAATGVMTFATNNVVALALGNGDGSLSVTGLTNIGPALASNFGDALRVRSTSFAAGTVEGARFEMHHTSAQTGSKYGIEAVIYGDHLSGTTDTHNAIRATCNLALGGGTITTANALSSNIVVGVSSTITNANGVNILAPTNNGTITNLTGLAIGHMISGASTNFAITTGFGLVQFGDTLILAASTGIRSGLRFPSGLTPGSPVDGDMWYDGTNMKLRVGGTTKTFTIT